MLAVIIEMIVNQILISAKKKRTGTACRIEYFYLLYLLRRLALDDFADRVFDDIINNILRRVINSACLSLLPAFPRP